MTAHLGPAPVPGPDDAPYWEGLRQRRLLLQWCSSCGAVRHPPQPRCGRCTSAAHRWEDASGAGTVHTFTVVGTAAHPELADAVPYVVALVELDEGPRVVSNVVDMNPEDVAIGLRVRVRFDDVGDGVVLPRFVAAEADR
jgi:uncharacterized OB-fold protein